MVGRRIRPDGLPGRLYARAGARITKFFIKNPDNTTTVLAKALTADPAGVARAKAKAIEEYGKVTAVAADDTARLIDDYFEWQAGLPPGQGKKAPSTIAENKREAENLKLFFGRMTPSAVQPHHCYAYIDARTKAAAKKGINAAVKAGKEISLLSAVFEYGRRRGKVRDNVAKGIEKPRNRPSAVLVTWEQVEHFCEVGRAAGGSYRIMGLAAMFAWLTVKRSNEVRSFTRAQVVERGCMFTASKAKGGEVAKEGLILWSPLLKACVDEALAIQRWGKHSIPARFVFGNMSGSVYTKGGWKMGWSRLHAKAAATAPMPWVKFSLQNCRPGGVTEKEERGDTDTVDATLHADGRMVATTYDRRRVRKARPAL